MHNVPEARINIITTTTTTTTTTLDEHSTSRNRELCYWKLMMDRQKTSGIGPHRPARNTPSVRFVKPTKKHKNRLSNLTAQHVDE